MLHGHGDEAGCRLRTARDDEAEGAPEVHTVAAWETYGCSLADLRLRAVAAWQTYGCSLGLRAAHSSESACAARRTRDTASHRPSGTAVAAVPSAVPSAVPAGATMAAAAQLPALMCSCWGRACSAAASARNATPIPRSLVLLVSLMSLMSLVSLVPAVAAAAAEHSEESWSSAAPAPGQA